MARVARLAAVLAAVVLSSAGCSDDGGQASDDTEVLGIQVERERATPAAGSSAMEPAPDISGVAPSPEMAVAPPSPAATAGNAGSSSAPTAGPPPPRASSPPPAASSPTGTAAESSPEPPPASQVREGPGHSYVTWFSSRSSGDADGDGTDGSPGDDPSPDATASSDPGPVWSAVSAAPRRDREPDPDSHDALRVRLDDPGRDAGAGHRVLTATCGTWLTAMDDRPLEARGTVIVEVRVDGAPVLEHRIPVDVVVPAGETHDLPRTDGVDVDAAEHDDVTCQAVFTTG